MHISFKHATCQVEKALILYQLLSCNKYIAWTGSVDVGGSLGRVLHNFINTFHARSGYQNKAIEIQNSLLKPKWTIFIRNTNV